jgi:hypothetical protein
MTNKQVFEKLKSLGSGASHEYVQATKTEQSKDEQIKNNKGICNGLCHDWVRRVLQGGKLEFAQEPNSEKDVKAVKRSGHGQINLLEPRVQMAILQELLDIRRDLQKVLESTALNIGISSNLANRLYKAGHLKVKTQDLKYPKTLLQQIYVKLGDGDKSQTMTTWNLTAFYWDSYWSKQRGNKSPHPFSNIDKISDDGGRTQYNTVYDGIADKLKTLSAGNMAVILGFPTDKKGTDGGHAIAAHRTNAGKYNFFDPNFGIFEYNGCSAVATAMVFLIDHAYKSFGWQTTHDNGKCELGVKTFVPVKWEPKEERLVLSRTGQTTNKPGVWSGTKTVTRTVNDPPQLSSTETRERVMKKVKELASGIGTGNGKVF